MQDLDYRRKIICDRLKLVEHLTDIYRPLVFTNGCFDILHRGHLDYLTRAAAFGKGLIVGVNDDNSVRRLNKGEGRPVNCLRDRIEVLAGLECIDYVVPFHEDTPLELIKLIQPDHLVKGGDWPTDQIVGGNFVSTNGGRVHSLPVRYPLSTSKLIRRLRNT